MIDPGDFVGSHIDIHRFQRRQGAIPTGHILQSHTFAHLYPFETPPKVL
jgi:hypothetical protein